MNVIYYISQKKKFKFKFIKSVTIVHANKYKILQLKLQLKLFIGKLVTFINNIEGYATQNLVKDKINFSR